MENASTNSIIILILMFFGLYYIYKCNEVKYVKSDIDSNRYFVLNESDAKDAANLLAQISNNLLRVKEYLNANHTDKPITKYINQRFDPNNISEGSPYSQYTSYTENKGEQIVFCIRDKETKKLHDLNLLMYVSLHELAHVGCETIGHNTEFQRNFQFLLSVAKQMGIYQNLDFGKQQINYCGLKL